MGFICPDCALPRQNVLLYGPATHASARLWDLLNVRIAAIGNSGHSFRYSRQKLGIASRTAGASRASNEIRTLDVSHMYHFYSSTTYKPRKFRKTKELLARTTDAGRFSARAAESRCTLLIQKDMIDTLKLSIECHLKPSGNLNY